MNGLTVTVMVMVIGLALLAAWGWWCWWAAVGPGQQLADPSPPYAWLVHGRVVHRAAGTFRIWTSLVHADTAAQACEVAGAFNLEAECHANGVPADSGVYWVCDTSASMVPLDRLRSLQDKVLAARGRGARSAGGVA